MGSETLFKGTIQILEKALDLRSMKHSLMVSNIANKDTPNYKAFDLAVEKEMEKITGNENELMPGRTHDRHIPFGISSKDDSDVVSIRSSKSLVKSKDGNSVDIEKEMTNLAENQLLYDATAQIMRKKLQGLKNVIQGGAK